MVEGGLQCPFFHLADIFEHVSCHKHYAFSADTAVKIFHPFKNRSVNTLKVD